MTIRLNLPWTIMYSLWHWKPVGEKYENDPFVCAIPTWDTVTVLRKDAQEWCRENLQGCRMVVTDHVPGSYIPMLEFDREEDAEAFRKLWIENTPEPPPEENGIDVVDEIIAALNFPVEVDLEIVNALRSSVSSCDLPHKDTDGPPD